MALINEGQVILDLAAPDRHEASRLLASRLVETGRCTDLETFIADVRAREEKTATGLPGGIGIPHARSTAITEPSLVFGRASEGIDWGAKDGPAQLIFMIAAPADGGDAHMQMLPKLARALMKKDFKEALANATTEAEVVDIVNNAVALDPPAAPAEPATEPVASPASYESSNVGTEAPAAAAVAAPAAAPAKQIKLVGVTSCPTGIAHTYMGAEALEAAAKEAGYEILVETQGSAGSTPLTAEQIADADAAIFAHELPVKDIGRFAGLPVIDVSVKKAISDGPLLVQQAVEAAAKHAANPGSVPLVAAGGGDSGGGGGLTSKTDANAPIGTQIRQWLMTGVSYMVPFVAAGGIMIALSFMLAQISMGEQGAVEIVKYGIGAEGAYDITTNFSVLSLTSWAALCFTIGGLAFNFLVPVLSGFIAFAIADRPGLVPGIVGGFIAAQMSAGFLGGIVTGILGGLIARWISSWKVHKGVRGVMPVVVNPLLATFITGGLFITVLGRPIAGLMTALTDWLNSMGGGSAFVLGIILGAMMGFDLGGPVNKVAYGFGAAGLATAGTATDSMALRIMAAVMAAGMVAPLAMALATTVRPKLFTEPERENGKAAWLLGASFISEGAIPFAATDPARVIASSVVGSALTGGLIMAFGSTLMAPHGGLWVLPLIGGALWFVLALLAGVVVMAAIVVALKSAGAKKAAVAA